MIEGGVDDIITNIFQLVCSLQHPFAAFNGFFCLKVMVHIYRLEPVYYCSE